VCYRPGRSGRSDGPVDFAGISYFERLVCFAGTVAIGVGNRATRASNLRHSAIGHGLWFYVDSMRRLLPGLLLVLVASASACKTDETIAVHSLTINGTHAVNPSQLRTALATREDPKLPLVNVRLPWTKRRNFFDRNRFDADLKRIEAYYADRGYPDARVTAFDVKLNDKHNAVDVSITVNEGEPVRIVSVAFQGFDMIPPSHFETLQKDVPLHVGDPRDRQAVLAARDLSLNELRDHGYPYSRVTSQENDGPDGKQASITLVAEPGPVANFGPIEITGNASVSDKVIRRQLLYKPGELYRRSALQETQRQLYGMSLFQFVNVEAVDIEAQDAEVKTKVTVVEGRHQRVNLGVGYGTEENGRVDAEYHHVNFLGGARSAGVHGRYSSLDRGLRLDFTQPYFFRPTFNLGAEGQRWYGAQLSEREPHCLRRSRRRRNAADGVADFRIRGQARDTVVARVERLAREREPLLIAEFRHSETERHLHLCGGIAPGAHRRQATGIRLNPGCAGRIDLGADVVQHHARQHLGPHRRHQQCHQATERSADHDEPRDRQLLQQRPHVIDIRAGVIVQPVRVVLRAAATALIGHDHAARGSDVLGERGEVAAVPREPVQTEHRRLARVAGVVAVVELQAVAAAKELFGERLGYRHARKDSARNRGLEKKDPELVARGREADFLKGSKAR